jgi:1,4-dihydroxy-2-naphthoate octaprenyltransferase
MSDGFAAAALAAALCSLAVKLTDDWLDRDRDAAVGRANWSVRLGTGAMVYAALFLALAAGINVAVSLALFFASYVVGMFTDLGRRLPSRLTGWQESLLVLAAGAALCGWRTMLFATLFVSAVQLIDDCVDLAGDRLAGQRNFACRFGTVECLLGGLTLLLAAWWLDAGLFVPVFAGVVAVYCLDLRIKEVMR